MGWKWGRNRIFYGLLGVLFFLSIISNSGCSQKSNASIEEAQNRPVPVTVAAVAKGSITRSVNLAAKLSPRMEVNLIPKVSGKVVTVTVDMGDSVSAGQVLVQMDTSDVEAQLRQAEAGLTMALAKQRIDQATLENARLNLQRVQELYAQGIVPQRDLDTAQMAFDQANTGIAEAQIEQAEAAVALARIQLQNLTLTAPISGQIASRKVNPGEMANPGVPVLTLVDLSCLLVEFNVPEGEINCLKMGDQLKIKVPAVSREPFIGQIVGLAPTADAQTKSFPVKLEITNPEHQLKPGMFAEVELTTDIYQDVLVLPKDAVVDKGDIKIVYVVRDNLTHETKVKTGASDLTSIVITEGLQEGDQVVVTGQNTVRDQTLVEVVVDPSGGNTPVN